MGEMVVEVVHQHNWVEVWGEKTVDAGSIGECTYCGYQSNDDIWRHCDNCGGVWTHEEILALGHAEGSFAYNSSIGRPKGSNWRYVPVYETINAILYYECDCGSVKPFQAE